VQPVRRRGAPAGTACLPASPHRVLAGGRGRERERCLDACAAVAASRDLEAAAESNKERFGEADAEAERNRPG